MGAGDEHRVKCGPLTARRILKTHKCGSGVHRLREGNPHIHAKRRHEHEEPVGEG